MQNWSYLEGVGLWQELGRGVEWDVIKGHVHYMEVLGGKGLSGFPGA